MEKEDKVSEELLEEVDVDCVKEEFEELIEELEKAPDKKLHTELWILEQVKGLYSWSY